MNTLLIVREEIACIIVVLLVLFNERLYDTGKDHRSFARLIGFALGHLVFDIITVITVNRLDTVPPLVNKACHVVFYLFAILYSLEVFNYIVALFYSKTTSRRIYVGCLLCVVLYVCALPMLPITYIQGRGTWSSYGPAAFAGYGLALCFLLGGIILILKNFKTAPLRVKRALLPMLIVMITAEILQVFIPELLFTGGTVTVITVAFFFALENPAEVFRLKAQVDALTGVDSRHSYEITMDKLEQSYARNPKLSFALVFCDINALKAVNNNFGHSEGDRYISTIAQILMTELRSAEKIFRMGGDEFLALYRDKDESVVRREMECVHVACARKSQNNRYTVAAAMGYAMSGGEYRTVRDMLRVADYLMYKNKAEIKQQRAYAFASETPGANLTGLTDRMFEAFAFGNERNYIYICNTETNVSRLSKPMVEYFGLPGEFIFDFPTLWQTYIHPDDRESFAKDIGMIFNGSAENMNDEYRVRNSDGEYVVVSCRGSVLRGKNGEPDLFGGTIVNHGIMETIDPVTGLPNERAFSNRLNEMVTRHMPGALVKFGITTFSRINMLYGYPNGNEVLCGFCRRIRQILRGQGQLFRIDGTEFAIILPNLSEEDARELFKRIRHAAGHEVTIDLRVIPLQLSAGALMIEDHFDNSVSALRSALIYAHEQSRYEQNGQLVFYTPPKEDSDVQDVKLLALVHQDALGERRGFHLCYQPIVSFAGERLIGAEALLRWQNEEYGVVLPGGFIPWLENDPCFFELGRWILKTALHEAKPMLERLPGFILNVNITMQQLKNEDFHDMVLDALREEDFPAANLCLELTERCKELDPAFLRSEIDFFHGQGLRIALDDVGTGSASFGLLLKLPLDEIKIDMSIVRGIKDQKPNQILARSIVDASETLRFMICFEGIEERSTYDYLSQYAGCCYQGYYYARPMSAADFIKRMDQPK